MTQKTVILSSNQIATINYNQDEYAQAQECKQARYCAAVEILTAGAGAQYLEFNRAGDCLTSGDHDFDIVEVLD